jgi:hypothetical protein
LVAPLDYATIRITLFEVKQAARRIVSVFIIATEISCWITVWMTDAIAVCRRILTPVVHNFPTAAAAGCITISISEVVGRKGQDK